MKFPDTGYRAFFALPNVNARLVLVGPVEEDGRSVGAQRGCAVHDLGCLPHLLRATDKVDLGQRKVRVDVQQHRICANGRDLACQRHLPKRRPE